MDKTYLMYKLDKSVNDHQLVLGDKYRFTILGNRMLRVEYSPSGKFEDLLSTFAINRKFDECNYKSFINNNTLTLETEFYHLYYQTNQKLDTIKIKMNNNNTYNNLLDDEVYNLRGTYRTLDMANGSCTLEKGLFSICGFAFLDDTTAPLFNDDGWMIERHFEEDYQDIYLFFFGNDFNEGLKEFAKLSGKTPLIPRYALGNWWSRYYVYNEESLTKVIKSFKEHNIPLSVCIIDMDWHITDVPWELRGGWTGYTWNRNLFPDPKRMIDYIHDNNLKTALNLHPAEGIRYFDDCYSEFAKAMDIDQNTKQTIPFDIFNPKFAQNYFKHALHPHEDIGVDFWWIDWQQGRKTKLSNIDPLFQLNHLHYLDTNNEKTKGFTFSRYPGKGGHRYPIGFSGDTIISWESLSFQPYFTANASNIAFSWWSHDIGGHCGGLDEDELYIRWLQYGVFSPIMRMHSTKNEFIIRAPFGRKNPYVLKVAQKYLYFRQQLIPYLYTAAYNNYINDEPLVKPLYYEYPKNNASYKYKNEYLFANYLIVNPVVSKIDPYLNVSITKTYLPKGDYYNLFTHQKFSGSKHVKIYSDLYNMPVFAKAGSIIPLAKLEPLNTYSNPKTLEILIFPGRNNEYQLYEDDGISNNYLKNENFITTFSLKVAKNNMILTIDVKGKETLIPNEREYVLKFININKNTVVHGKKFKIIDNYYDENDKILNVILPYENDKLTITLTNEESIEADRKVEFLKHNIYDFILNLNEMVDNKNEIQDHLLNNLELPNETLIDIIENKVKKLPTKAKKVLIDLINQSV